MAAPEPIPDLLKAVNDASAKAFALWLTFLSIMIYLAIAIGTTTHRQLLMETPVKLPLLSVDLTCTALIKKCLESRDSCGHIKSYCLSACPRRHRQQQRAQVSGC